MKRTVFTMNLRKVLISIPFLFLSLTSWANCEIIGLIPTPTSNSCSCDGTIEVNASPPGGNILVYSLNGNNWTTSPVFPLLCSGNYTVSIGEMDAWNVTEPPSPNYSGGSCDSETVTLSANNSSGVSLTCPDNLLFVASTTSCDAVVSWQEPSIDGSCASQYRLQRDFVSGSDIANQTTQGTGIYTICYEVVEIATSQLMDNCCFVVQVDDQDIEMSCPTDITVNVNANCAWTATGLNPTIIENCSPPHSLGYIITGATNELGDGSVDGISFNIGVSYITYTVSDDMGNNEICLISVTVEDGNPPLVSCQNNIIEGTDSGQCTAGIEMIYPIATDNCGFTMDLTFIAIDTDGTLPDNQYDITSGESDDFDFPVGVTQALYTVTDNNNNVSSCSIDITVIDDSDPYINCLANLSLGTSSDGEGNCETMVTIEHPSTSDNCSDPLLEMSINGGSYSTIGSGSVEDMMFAKGFNKITYRLTDSGNNTITCTRDVVIEDDELPFVSFNPVDVYIDSESSLCGAIVQYDLPLFGDNCDGANLEGILVNGSPSGSFFPLGTTIVRYEYLDADGNGPVHASFYINIEDNEDPVITYCPADMTVSNNPGHCSAIVNYPSPSGTDNCPGYTVVLVDGMVSGSAFPVGTTQMEFIISDQAGNTASCSFKITVEDDEPFALNCPADITVFTNDAAHTDNVGGDCSAVITYGLTAGITDNCDAFDVSYVLSGATSASGVGDAIGEKFNVGVTTISYTVTSSYDPTDTETCSFNVTIEDNESPVLDCPIDVFSCEGGALEDLTNLINVSDNCSGTLTFTQDPPVGTFFDPSASDFNVTLTATDEAGNSSSCVVEMQVVDTTVPYFVDCPANGLSFGNDQDKCGAYVNWDPPVALDNCDSQLSINQVSGPNSGSFLDVGTHMVVYEAEDEDGNTAQCEMEIQIYDTQEPDILLFRPADITLSCIDADSIFADLLVISPNDVDDNCPGDLAIEGPILHNSTRSNDPTECEYYSYIDTYTWRVTDEAGNIKEWFQDITFIDTIAPKIVASNMVLALDASGNGRITEDDVMDYINSSDNCAELSALNYDINISDFDCADVGNQVEITMTISDPCGNTTWTYSMVLIEESVPCLPVYQVTGSDPCICKNNASTLTDGQFDEVVSLMSVAGQTWTIQAIDGFYLSSSPAPPLDPIPVPLGTAFVDGIADGLDNDLDGTIDEADENIYYSYAGLHVDGEGFNIIAVNNDGVHYSFSNTCFYPTPAYNFGDEVCINTTPFNIEVSDILGKAGTVNSLTIDGVATTVFDPEALGLGSHIIEVEFDAGTPKGYTVLNGVPVVDADHAVDLADAAANPGCVQSSSIFMQVVAGPSSFSCNGHINLSLDPNCYAEVNADMFVEGYDGICTQGFSVIVYDSTGAEHPTSFDINDVNQTFTVEIVDELGSGNNCWGTVLVEEKYTPQIECPADITITCNQMADTTFTGSVLLLSCEFGVTVTYEDEFTDNGYCATPRASIVRTWSVEDQSGLVATCQQNIEITQFNLDNIVFPADFTGTVATANPPYALSCADVANDPSLTEPENTGVPQLNDADLQASAYCDITIGYWDELLDFGTCDGTYEILRHWLVRDLCLPIEDDVNPIKHVQSILVIDNTPPVFVNCPTDITVFADPYNCYYTFDPASIAPDVDDDCSDNISVTSYSSSNSYSLEPGDHTITYVASDDCYNTDMCEINVTVIDNTSPINICDQHTTVTLTTDGIGVIYAESLDDGSIDNCGIENYEVRRVVPAGCGLAGNTTFNDYVELCCEDVYNNPIMVILRVYDYSGNYNDCMVEVEVQDKLDPVISCAPDITVSCDFVFDVAALEDINDKTFGRVVVDPLLQEDVIIDDPGDNDPDPVNWGPEGVVTENCMTSLEITVQDQSYCGKSQQNADGSYEPAYLRTFLAMGPSGTLVSCTQRIYVVGFNSFTNDDIDWPEDYTVGCSDGLLPEDLPTGFDYPVYQDKACSQLEMIYDDQVFYHVDGICQKILREWTIVDWCSYDVNNPSLGGRWDYTQVIKVENAIAPTFVVCADVTIDATDDCGGDATLTIDAFDDCDTLVTDYAWAIDQFNDGTMDDFGQGDSVTVTYPVGTHKVTFVARDNCGNEATCEYLFTIKDNKQPTPVCISGLSTVVMPSTGVVTIWANDFNASSFDNCTPQEDLIYSFSSDVTETGMTFTCDEVGSNEVEIWVTDASGNQDYCETFIIIADNDTVCNGISHAFVGGVIMTEEEELVSSVGLSIFENGALIDQFLTDGAGVYLFDDLSMSEQYEVEPFKNDNHLNGVTTLDLVKIQKHLLGTEFLSSPYKMIAADANNSGNISALDIIQIRQLILGVHSEFPDNLSWRFVEEDFIFVNPGTPWPFNESISYSQLNPGFTELDFIGVKVGDVNNSVQANFDETSLEDRAEGTLQWYTEAIELDRSEVSEIKIKANDLMQLEGFQLSMSTKDLIVEEIIGKAISINESNYALHKDMLTISWNTNSATELEKDDVIFSLMVKADKPVNLKDIMDINSSITPAEAYGASSELYDIQLDFIDKSDVPNATEFALHQNEPNPFSVETKIGFSLPKDSEAVLTVYNVEGKEVYRQVAQFNKGYNEVKLKKSDLKEYSSMLYYRLEADGFNASKTMTIIE